MFHLLCRNWLCALSRAMDRVKHLFEQVSTVCCADYAVIPLVREIANILGQSVPRSNIEAENDASDTDTIPYGRGDEECHSDVDFNLAPVL